MTWWDLSVNSSAVSFLERGIPTGDPVLHFHGWPSSRLEQFASDALLLECGLRWFSLDRPGYGSTHRPPGRTLGSWAAQVAAWADSQNLDRFHVLGFSAGGAFAQSVAAGLPHRVKSLTLIASLSPFAPQGVDCPPPWGFWGRLGLRHAPGLLRGGFRLINRYRRSHPLAYERRQLHYVHPIDRQLLLNDETLERRRRSHEVAFTQGIDHVVEDLQLLDRVWDIDHSAIRCPVKIWVGSDDFQVPAACSHWLAKRIPHASLTEFPGEAHYIPVPHAEEIVRAIPRDPLAP